MTPFVIDFLLEGHGDSPPVDGVTITFMFFVTTRCNVITRYNVATKEHNNDVVTSSNLILFNLIELSITLHEPETLVEDRSREMRCSTNIFL